MSDGKVLNLDELFGEDRPVVVRWQGREYGLLRLQAFSPKEIREFEGMQAQAVRLQHAQADNDEVMALFDRMLLTLCKELPVAEMPFMAKTRIITFYIEETQGKKVLEAAMATQPPIGARPSAV